MAVTLLAAVLAVGGAAAATPLHLGGRLDTETPFILPRTLFMLSHTLTADGWACGVVCSQDKYNRN